MNIALKHDIAYNSTNLENRHVEDVKMIHELNSIPNPTFREKIERALVKNILKAKIELGGKVSTRSEQIPKKRSEKVSAENNPTHVSQPVPPNHALAN